MNIPLNALIERAQQILDNSYAPYSGIHVAAVVMTSSGNVYLGVNVENASYGLTICAERVAIASMITNGERDPVAVAIVTDFEKPLLPCGACRQVIAEFNREAVIISYSVKSGEKIAKKLSELLPEPFVL